MPCGAYGIFYTPHGFTLCRAIQSVDQCKNCTSVRSGEVEEGEMSLSKRLLKVASFAASWFNMVFVGWVVTVLWGWFVTPTFDLPELNIPTAIGVYLILSIWAAPIRKPSKEEITEKVLKPSVPDMPEMALAWEFTVFYTTLLTLAFGWVVALFT
ncbi:hypothetical protein CR983_01280 [Candidatus Saccharibacteria bacterium]|nr:MAG: hypothetical protein CR983_01280 [Candidatus Saccharibacteria bacterium]